MKGFATNLYNLAEMDLTEETRHPSVIHLVTGHYRERGAYRASRAQGTPDWLLLYTLAGQGLLRHEEGETRIGAGEVVLYRAGTPHDYGVEETTLHWEYLWTHFQPRAEWLNWLNWPEDAPGQGRLKLLDPKVRERVEQRFLEAHRWAMSGLRQREALAMNALEELLIWCDTQNPRAEHVQGDARINTVTEYLREHLAEKVSLTRMAEVCGLSVSRMAHLFREQVGLTPQQYLEYQRLDHARKLLELTFRSVEQIALEVGFESPFYFARRFKHYLGTTPSLYRKHALSYREVADPGRSARESEAYILKRAQ